MVNDLKELMRANVAAPPPEHLDLDGLVTAGRRRVRTRRTLVGGGAALLVAGVLVGTSVSWSGSTDANGPDAADRRPTPSGPVLRLADATPAVEGTDYRVLAQHTNDNLDRDNGQYFDGVTDDGLILFRDGPRMDQLRPRFALLDPATGEKDWLPDLDVGQEQTWPVVLGEHQLVLASERYDDSGDGMSGQLVAYVFDRDSRQWSTLAWPDLPDLELPRGVLGPDGRLYVRTPATQGKIPEGGWPTQADGDAEDADAEGDTYHLWSVSLTDEDDVRDEGLTVGDVAFTDTAMVWTDSANGAAGRVHVRDLATGDEHDFDPHLGERCNLLSFGASGDRIAMGQYCGTYGNVRDDRMQILDTDGRQVVTIQDDSVDGWLSSTGYAHGLVTLSSYQPAHAGTYVYDLDTDRFLRISDAMAKWGTGGAAPAGQLLWDTPVNGGHGATSHLGELLTS